MSSAQSFAPLLNQGAKDKPCPCATLKRNLIFNESSRTGFDSLIKLSMESQTCVAKTQTIFAPQLLQAEPLYFREENSGLKGELRRKKSQSIR
ncbi:MAG: hypothetical protein A3B72_05085 [Omnitrophica bacterium RIFCSPHIGHO2_02_FULL_45_28]|nr:MAG: hypothetical protein A3B72_05085 [Omnitrophica bacterium RIFCSPHIGHO2_02_FULL_45_28]